MAYGRPTDPTNVMGRRFLAWFIDFVPAVILVAIFARHNAVTYANVPSDFCTTFRQSHNGYLCFNSGTSAYTSPGLRGAAILVWLVYYFAIAGVLQGATGASLGKHVVGLRVVDQNGALCTMGQAFLRTLIGVFEIGFCFVIGLIAALVSHPHRRLGDLAAGTFVVSKAAVGQPITGASSTYPPPWTPPGAPAWGPPPAGGAQPWGTPPPTWGAPPPASAPPPTNAPQSWGQPPAATPTPWGTPAASPPPAETPSPAEVHSPSPTTEAPAATPSADAPGWGAPSMEPAPAAAPPQAQPPPPSRDPQWDAQRNAWVYWEVETSRWLQHDPITGQWGPLR
jgi:RDD family